MKKAVIALTSFISIYVSLFLVYPLIASFFLDNTPKEILVTSVFVAPLFFFLNLFVALFLFLAGFMFLTFIELRKARDAYNNARNRIGFIKDKQVVCFEGEIQPKEGWTPLLSPISQKECVVYYYGNKWVGGGSAQVKTVIKPSGETIPLNGWLSGDYVEKREYDPSKTDLNHLLSFMTKRKDKKVQEKDVAKAPYFYTIPEGTDQRDNFENHEILDSLDEENFKENKYTEIVIPSGTYGWALGRWDDNKKQLTPLKFSAHIYVIQKDYKKTFLKYISKYRRNYLIGVFSLILLAGILSLPIFLNIFLG